jgi:hypothetical protein
MNFSKKLALFIPLVLGIQFSSQAYDAASLKQELQSIASFIQELRQQNSAQAQTLARWLERKVLDASNTTNNDIIAMAIVANKHESKTQSQITTLSKKISYLIGYAFVTSLAVLAGLARYYQYLQKERNSGWD